MVCSLHDIERVCSPAPGGLKSVTLIIPENVYMFPQQYCVPNVGDIVLGEGATSYTIEFERNTARLVDKTNTSRAAGDTFDYTLSFSLQEIRLDVEWLRAKLANRRVHVIAEYRTGLQRLLPNMRLTSDSDSGDRIGARQRYTFSFTTSLDKPAPTINSSLTGTGGGGVVETPDPPGLTIGQVITPVSGIVDIPSGKLIHAIVITPAASTNTVQIGTSPGGDEIMSPETIPAGEHHILNTAYYFSTAGTLHVQVVENCSIIVYLR